MISAKVIADSKNEFGNRITTMVVTFPRIILAEFNTHRMFSRNSASSRAIPFEKMVKSVEENPFVPIAWQKDHKGMQGTEYLDLDDNFEARTRWISASKSAIQEAILLHKDCGGGELISKQLCNRLLEPFMWHTVIVTATEWENFFALRCPKYKVVDGLNEFGLGRKDDGVTYFRSWKDLVQDTKAGEVTEKFLSDYTHIQKLKINAGQAEIHMMALAEAMWDAYNESTPKQLKAGEWHIPFGDKISVQLILEQFDKENKGMSDKILNELEIKIATARCARVSYTVVGEEGKPDSYEADIKLHDRLAASGHWSPFEHCAKAMNKGEYCWGVHRDKTEGHVDSNAYGWSGNFRGFVQYRKMFANENIK